MEKYVVVDQALMCATPEEELEMLHRTGLLEAIYPEVAAMVGFGGGSSGHKDLWWHTKLVVAQTVAVRAVRWAALFHDVGKVPTFSRASGKVTFHGHEVVSARLFDVAARRTGLERPLRKRVRHLVRHLGQVESYASDWTDSAVRRLHRQLAEAWDDAIQLACADITTKHAHKRRQHRARMTELAERARAIEAQDAALPLLPKGLGRVVIDTLGLEPGPMVGETMKRLERAVEAGEVPPRAPADVYVDYLKRRAASDGPPPDSP
ncbi:MAG: HDIG domain-containing metalloprotein [Myxococcota bacterium]